MTQYREILRLHSRRISQRSIASSCQCSRNTVARVLARAREMGIGWPLKSDLTDGDLEKMFFPNATNASLSRKLPDLEYIHKEAAKPGVTLRLLWSEYCSTCRLNNETPLMYSQFCYHYQKFAEKKHATMHILRKPGEQIEVDWAGQTASIINDETGEIIPVYIFVSVLAYSQYAYVEAFLSRDQESWIAAHVNMYQFYGGVSKILVPDNLKTGVERSDWYDPKINKTYHEMAEHYDTVVIPARVRKPQDKPNAEGTVGIISTWIIAALRNQQYFRLSELSRDIHEKLEVFNRKPFQKKEGSRLSIFLEQEKAFLLPLPKTPYELATWKIATVQINYHIAVEKMNYSVPYEYIHQKVDVRITRQVIEVFFNNHRICSHPRLYGYPGQYSTLDIHMPTDHQAYVQWNAVRFIAWAQKIGPKTEIAIKAILSSYKIEQQSYKSCLSLIKLADKYSLGRLEAACNKALFYTSKPSYKIVKTILSTGQDKVAIEPESKTERKDETYGFTRGADYYGRKNND
jgi:transposase